MAGPPSALSSLRASPKRGSITWPDWSRGLINYLCAEDIPQSRWGKIALTYLGSKALDIWEAGKAADPELSSLAPGADVPWDKLNSILSAARFGENTTDFSEWEALVATTQQQAKKRSADGGAALTTAEYVQQLEERFAAVQRRRAGALTDCVKIWICIQGLASKTLRSRAVTGPEGQEFTSWALFKQQLLALAAVADKDPAQAADSEPTGKGKKPTSGSAPRTYAGAVTTPGGSTCRMCKAKPWGSNPKCDACKKASKPAKATA